MLLRDVDIFRAKKEEEEGVLWTKAAAVEEGLKRAEVSKRDVDTDRDKNSFIAGLTALCVRFYKVDPIHHQDLCESVCLTHVRCATQTKKKDIGSTNTDGASLRGCVGVRFVLCIDQPLPVTKDLCRFG